MLASIRCLPLVLLLACAPRWADRAVGITDAAPASPRPAIDPSPPSTDPSPPPALDAAVPADARDAAAALLDAGRDATVRADAGPPDQRPLDAPADSAASPMADAAADRMPDVPARLALLVVRDLATPTAGDLSLRALLLGMALPVRLASDEDPVDVTGVRIVVLAASCLSNNLGARYRDVTVPIVSAEPAVLDDLGMTGPVEGMDWEETEGDFITIVLPSHQMAAGLSGMVTVTDQPATLTWGRPATTAERVATFGADAERAAIFGYARSAPMVTGRAPARRVAFFAADLAAAHLTGPGAQLFASAVLWALR